MQGFVFSEFQDYVQKTYGQETWDEIAEKLHVAGKTYSLFRSYPTEDLEHLITAVSHKIHRPYQDILEDYGMFIAPKLWKICKRMIPSKWTLIDLLENLMGFSNQLLAHAISGVEAPPMLRCVKTGDNQVTIHYYSPRKLCYLGKGIVKGLGIQYDCDVSYTEPHCMHRGDEECEIVFNVIKKPPRTQEKPRP